MANETEQLVVSLEARIKDFERNFQRANRTATNNFQQIERQAKRSADALEQSMSKASQGVNIALAGLKGGIAGLVAGLSVGSLDAIVTRVAGVTREIANVGNEAKRAGLSTKAFQELGFVAQQNRIPIDALTDGMKELSLRADEFIVTGQGSAAEAFQRLGFGANDLKKKLEDPSTLLVEIIGKLEQFDKAAQIRIADELFGGTGGERFVELLDRGAAGVRDLINQAHELGAVMDDDVIARADELDRKFNALGTSISTYTKQAVLGLVGAMDDLLDSFNKIDEQSTRNVQDRLVGIYDKLAAERQHLADLQQVSIGSPADTLNISQSQKEIERLTNEALRLRDILDRRNGYSENFIYQAGQGAKQTTPLLNGMGTAGQNAAKGINSFADAVRALQKEIPDLASSLATLDAKARIDGVYRAAIAKAQGQREIALANEMRGAALKSLNIKSATDDPSKYLSNVLASGKNASHITGMQSGFSEKLAKMLASMPGDLKGSVTINSGYRSPERQQELWLAALQKYGSPEAARKWVAPPGNSQHNKGNAADLGYSSDAAKQWMHQNAGSFGLSFPLGNEDWHIEDETARAAAHSDAIQQQTTKLTQQAEAYRRIVTEVQAFTTEQQTEQQALAMTGQAAAAYRYEQQMLADAQRQGLPLTAQQRQEIAQLAQGMAAAEKATEQFSMTQEQAREVSGFFASSAADALSGLIMGTTTAEDALKQLIAQLARAALQAALLGEGPLAGLLGGGGKSGSGGILGTIFGGLFGAKTGGYITPGGIQHFAGGGDVRGPGGPREDKIPAMLSDGEFVVNAAATRKNRRALETINSGKAPALQTASIATGGNVLNRSSVTNTFAPTIPITVQASGNRETDAAMRDALMIELDTMLDAKMVQFTQDQQRPGAMMNKRGFV